MNCVSYVFLLGSFNPLPLKEEEETGDSYVCEFFFVLFQAASS
ncbi:hypothetical protein LEP1GSC198_1422 [Leptospira kirschneri str. JB]|nr:hypothetical protein [Leptospira kirschneri]EMJ90981.1 hypothetical protein LEP1GSC198_1422 [Leptospira kirschneri str. JB]